jgi:hypothetical protein
MSIKSPGRCTEFGNPEKVCKKDSQIACATKLNNFKLMTDGCNAKLESLYEALLNLEQAIDPILRCSQPTCKKDEENLLSDSAIEQFIDKQCEKINLCISLVNSYMERCSLI